MLIVESRELNVDSIPQPQTSLERQEIVGILATDPGQSANFLETILAKAKDLPKLPGEVNF